MLFFCYVIQPLCYAVQFIISLVNQLIIKSHLTFASCSSLPSSLEKSNYSLVAVKFVIVLGSWGKEESVEKRKEKIIFQSSLSTRVVQYSKT